MLQALNHLTVVLAVLLFVGDVRADTIPLSTYLPFLPRHVLSDLVDAD